MIQKQNDLLEDMISFRCNPKLIKKVKVLVSKSEGLYSSDDDFIRCAIIHFIRFGNHTYTNKTMR